MVPNTAADEFKKLTTAGGWEYHNPRNGTVNVSTRAGDEKLFTEASAEHPLTQRDRDINRDPFPFRHNASASKKLLVSSSSSLIITAYATAIRSLCALPFLCVFQYYSDKPGWLKRLDYVFSIVDIPLPLPSPTHLIKIRG